MPLIRPARFRFASALALCALGCDVSSSSKEKVECRAPACENREAQGTVCDNNASIQLGKYRVLNNLWGVRTTQIAGEQCIWSTCDASPGIGWGTNYNWLGGPASQVESYTAAILGWHFSTIDPASGLPLRLSDNRDVTCTWNYRLTQEEQSSQNVAYDIWLGLGDSPAGDSVPTDELMIWLYRSGGASPIGGGTTKVVEIGGGNWELHEGSTGNPSTGRGWKVHSFLRTSNTPCATLNIRDFLDVLIANGLDSDPANPKYLWGIEAGSEIFSGVGKLETDYYGCEL